MTERRPLLLDLFCGGGGGAVGYHRAGFDVVGVDVNPQPHYPYRFVQGDAVEYLDQVLAGDRPGFAAIHASPPCQSYTRKPARWGRPIVDPFTHPDLVAVVRDLLDAAGLPYVIENVVGAPVRPDLLLCGTMFGLAIQKHRLFESNAPLPLAPGPCDHMDTYTPWEGAGRSADRLRAAQGIDWLPTAGGASRHRGVTGDLFNALPPAYTEYVGRALLDRPARRQLRLFDAGEPAEVAG